MCAQSFYDAQGLSTRERTRTRHRLAPWLFAGTGLENGDRFASFGVEADRRGRASPTSLRILATIPHIFNARHAAEMTYYEARSGAHVFAAGAFTLAGPEARCATVARFLANLWDTLAGAIVPEQSLEAAEQHCPVGRR